MKRLLLVTLIPLLIFGCVSNKAFREEKARIDKIESALAQNNTELGVLRKEIMQDRRSGAGSSKEEIEALVTVIREISDDQMKQNALMQEDIAFLMDKMSKNPMVDASGATTGTDPQMVNRMNALADNLEKSSTDLNQKIAAMQKDINALNADLWVPHPLLPAARKLPLFRLRSKRNAKLRKRNWKPFVKNWQPEILPGKA
jgi:outer membrane murein-binding lipoprotein Lpp